MKDGINFGKLEAPSTVDEMAHNYSLTRTEKRAVIYLCDELGWNYSKLKRNPNGVDFTYNCKLGVEVKRGESYSLSRKQLEDINNHDITIVIISKNRGCWVDKAITDVGFVSDKDRAIESVMEIVNNTDG